MNLDVFCLAALCLSAAFTFGSIVITMVVYKKSKGNGNFRILSVFQIFLLCFFIAATVMFFPIYYVDYLDDNIVIIRIFKALILSMQNVLRLITLNGDFNNIKDFLEEGGRIKASLGVIYSIYSSVVILALPLLTAGYILSFFKNAVSAIRYGIRKNCDVYIFSELNEKSVALAKDIKTCDNEFVPQG